MSCDSSPATPQKSEEVRFLTNVESLGSFLVDETTKLRSQGLTELNPEHVNFVFRYLTGKGETSNGRDMISTFIEETFDKWVQVKDRNSSFIADFIVDILQKCRKNSNLPIPKITEEHRQTAIQMFDPDSEGSISPESLNSIWEYLDALVIISIKYVHRIRKPVRVLKDGVARQAYSNNQFPAVKTLALAKDWKIRSQLTWPEEVVERDSA